MEKFLTNSFLETQKLGEELAKEILAQGPKSPLAGGAVVLVLHGDLGGGKTTFLQGFTKGLGIKEKILSPTFVIMKCFQLPSLRVPPSAGRSNLKIQIASSPETPRNDDSSFNNFYHIDCYRINKPEEILELGLKKIISNSKNIVAIEWPERIKKVLPKNALKIKFKLTCLESRRRVDENKREIIIISGQK